MRNANRIIYLSQFPFICTRNHIRSECLVGCIFKLFDYLRRKTPLEINAYYYANIYTNK